MGYARPMQALAYALGDDDPSGLTDPRVAYQTWAAAVKQNGGYVTNFPLHVQGTVPTGTGDLFGWPAAAYPFDVIYPAPDYTLSALFGHEPDGFTADSSEGYFVAPLAVLRYAAGITAPNTVPGESLPPNPKWYDDLLTYGKYAAVGIGVLIVLDVASHLPRPRR